MKKPLIVLAVSAAVVAYSVQVSIPPALSGHNTKLKEAQVLKAKLIITEVGGASTNVDFHYSKPNMLKIETPTRLIVSDGTTTSILDKANNTYTQAAYDKAVSLGEATAPEVWAWSNFFEADPAKLYKTAKAVGQRKFLGADTTEVEVGLVDGKSTATLFIGTKNGIALGYTLKSGSKEYVVRTESIETRVAADPPTMFTFVAPANATKVEPNMVAEVGWSDVSTIFVRNCMPCHSGQTQSGGLNLTTYEAVASNRFVVNGDAKNSVLVLSLRASGAKRMPQGRPPLPSAQIKTIESWINGGLKQ